jgi:carbonic anhydrase
MLFASDTNWQVLERDSADKLKSNLLRPQEVQAHGIVFDEETGESETFPFDCDTIPMCHSL